MFLFLWLLAVPVLFYLYLEIKHYRKKKILSRLPGAPTLPLLGNAHQFGNTPAAILENLFEWWHQFDHKNYRVWVGYSPNVCISNAKDLEFVMNSNTLINKSIVYELLHPWLGTGLLTATGSKWHKHRKMITPSFHFKILQDFHETMNIKSTKFIEKLRKVSAGETIFDFQECAHYVTLDVICDTAMGVSINAMDNPDSEIVRAFKDMCYNINMRAFNPLKRVPALYKFFPEYPAYKKTLTVLQDFTYDVIKKRIKARDEAAKSGSTNEEANTEEYTKRRMAFLDTLLSSTIDNKPLTLEEIYEEVSTFIFEGHDTTTSGVAFAVYLLSRHPEILRKVYAEQQAVMGPNLKRDATFQEIAEMKYLDLVIKETERLYPSVPIIGRETEKDYDINGTLVPKGTTLNLFLMALGYTESIYKDPYICRPERFDTEKPGPFEYLPFSAGPRNCIGQKFAVLELKTVVSKVVREFEILPALDELVSKDGSVQNYVGLPKAEQLKRRPNPHKYDPILSAVLTLKSENGLHLRLRPRK